MAIHDFQSNLAERMCRPYSYAMSLCRRRISFAIQHGVARQLLNAKSGVRSLSASRSVYIVCSTSLDCYSYS